jgi:hypothetical protein
MFAPAIGDVGPESIPACVKCIQSTESTAIDEPLDRQKVRIPTTVLKCRQHSFAATCESNQLIRLRGSQTQRLVDDDMHVRFKRRARLTRVQVIRCGYYDDIDVLARPKRSLIVEYGGSRQHLKHSIALSRDYGANGNASCLKQWRMEVTAGKAEPDQCGIGH